MSENPTEREILWREYALNADLYKFYFAVCIKSNIFYFRIVGGIVSFVLTRNQFPMAKYALALPVIMSLFVSFLNFRVNSVFKLPSPFIYADLTSNILSFTL